MQGIIIQATSEGLKVRLKEGGQTCDITFDPKEYRSFQLGYATTYYRAQGKTVEKAYILHSPMMNKEMFYVGLTRQFRKVECLIAKEDIRSLSDLKRQAYRETPKETTLDYTTSYDLQKQRHLEALKTSDSMLGQAKRIGLSLLQEIQTYVIEPYLDKRPGHAFFNPKIENNQKITTLENLESLTLKPKPIFQTSKIKEKQQKEVTISNNLSSGKENLLQDYYKLTESAFSLHLVVKSDEESPHFHEWQKMCGVELPL